MVRLQTNFTKISQDTIAEMDAKVDNSRPASHLKGLQVEPTKRRFMTAAEFLFVYGLKSASYLLENSTKKIALKILLTFKYINVIIFMLER
jgi:hypothetical protein